MTCAFLKKYQEDFPLSLFIFHLIRSLLCWIEVDAIDLHPSLISIQIFEILNVTITVHYILSVLLVGYDDQTRNDTIEGTIQ